MQRRVRKSYIYLSIVGASAALQLDINVGMVYFDATQSASAGLAPARLVDSWQAQYGERFLNGDKRDFFYVATHDSS